MLAHMDFNIWDDVKDDDSTREYIQKLNRRSEFC